MAARGGLLISVEGVDGAGKTTQVSALSASLTARGEKAVVVRPEDTALGAFLQRLLLEHREGAPLEPWAEALLFTAGRTQLLREVILPALGRGNVVIADRYMDSTLAYQGGGRGLSLDALRRLQDEACAGMWPDVTILLELPAGRAASRQRSQEVPLDRFETASGGFQARVGACFATLAEADPGRIVRVDADRPEGAVAAEIESAILDRLADRRSAGAAS
ncbi:MAG: dTMP kinase [Candidatus Dormibacteria bacterium]